MTIVDVLRRGGVQVTTASLGERDVEGAHGIRVQADATLDDALGGGASYDAVVLPGGMPGATHLREDARVRAAACGVVESGGTAAAICAAPIVLEAAGLLDGRRATAYPSFRDQLVSASPPVEGRVVEDGRIVTSAGPGTALEFALTLVARLSGPEVAEGLRSGMLVRS